MLLSSVAFEASPVIITIGYKTSSPLLDRLIGAGHAGMKSGLGLRTWTPEEVAAVQERLARHLIRMRG